MMSTGTTLIDGGNIFGERKDTGEVEEVCRLAGM